MTKLTPELKAKIDKSREVGAELATAEPRAVLAWYDKNTNRIDIELTSGVFLSIPCELLQGLEEASHTELAKIEVTLSGYGLHWEGLDVDLSIPGLLAGMFGTKKHMAELGRSGGRSKSPAKTQAAKKNGKLGGRPKKNKEG